VAILALTGALATAAFVRAFGAVFLARPRSDAAESAKESPNSMLVGMALLVAMCVAGGLMAGIIIPLADMASSSVLGVSAADLIVDGWVVQSTNPGFSSMSPLLIAVLLLAAIPVGFLISGWIGSKRKARQVPTWDCGTPLSARNEYSATAFSQPIARVFSAIYRPQTEVHTEYTNSPYVKKKVSYTNRLLPVFEKYLYRPAVDLSVGMARRFSRIQAGSIQAYLAYIFVMLVLLLIIFR
jgi:hydrogenase-4 component B